jgi:excisionase family DNA binding protein
VTAALLRPAPDRAGFTVDEVSGMLKLSRGTIYALLRTGELRSFTIGRARRIIAESVAELIDARTEESVGQ